MGGCGGVCVYRRALENLRFLFMPVGWGHTGEWYSIILPLKGCSCEGVNRTSPMLLPYLLSRFQCFSHKAAEKKEQERRKNTWIFSNRQDAQRPLLWRKTLPFPSKAVGYINALEKVSRKKGIQCLCFQICRNARPMENCLPAYSG